MLFKSINITFGALCTAKCLHPIFKNLYDKQFIHNYYRGYKKKDDRHSPAFDKQNYDSWCPWIDFNII